MKTYGGKYLDHQKLIFNYRLSKARRVTFLISKARWCIFKRPVEAVPERYIQFTKAFVALSNFLMLRDLLTTT